MNQIKTFIDSKIIDSTIKSIKSYPRSIHSLILTFNYSSFRDYEFDKIINF